MKKIYYIGFHSDKIGRDEGRYCSPAAVDKMNYIASSLVRAGYEVEIISPGWSTKKEWKWLPARLNRETSGLTIRYMPTVVLPFRLMKPLVYLFSQLWLFWRLSLYCKQGDSVLVYHSVFLYEPIWLARKFRRFSLALEIEEIYNLLIKASKRKEDALISLAEKYIFANKQLSSYFKNGIDKNKRFCVINGSYKLAELPAEKRSPDNIIRVVYAGTIDDIRGVFKAVQCAQYLGPAYRICIAGAGESHYVEKLKFEIENINEKAGYAKCEYFGLLSGREFQDFLSGCDIAINPQNPDEGYMQYAFPSKILNYLSYNLRTVSTYLKCIAESEFADLVVLVSNNTPEDFANAIRKIDVHAPFDARARIKKADENFVKEIGYFFS